MKDKCALKPSDNDQVHNIYRSIIDWPQMKYLRCHQLLCSTKSWLTKRPAIDNLIVKVTFYDNNGDDIIGFCNIIVELNSIISLLTIKIQ